MVRIMPRAAGWYRTSCNCHIKYRKVILERFDAQHISYTARQAAPATSLYDAQHPYSSQHHHTKTPGRSTKTCVHNAVSAATGTHGRASSLSVRLSSWARDRSGGMLNGSRREGSCCCVQSYLMKRRNKPHCCTNAHHQSQHRNKHAHRSIATGTPRKLYSIIGGPLTRRLALLLTLLTGSQTKGVLQGVLTGVFCTVAAAWGWLRRLFLRGGVFPGADPPCRTPPDVGMMLLAPMVCPDTCVCRTTSGATIASAVGASSRSTISRAAATRAKRPENIFGCLSEAVARMAGAAPATNTRRAGMRRAACSVLLCMHARTKRLP